MEIDNERTEVTHKFDLDLSEKEAKILAECGLDSIKNDQGALINYAVNMLMQDMIDRAEKKEGVKDGKSNS